MEPVRSSGRQPVIRLITASVAGLLIVGGGNAGAQDTARHQGFWAGFGVGGGWDVTMTKTEGPLFGAAGYLRLGGTIHDRLLVGGETTGWASKSGDRSWFQNSVMVTALIYPSGRRNLFFKGGTGLGTAVRRHPGPGGERVTDTDVGFASGLGVGHDFRAGGNVFVTPTFELILERISIPAGTVPPSTSVENTLIVLLTVGITWH